MLYKHIIVSTLIAVLLVSTMGINVHTLYCLCKDSLSVSLFELEDACGKKESTVALPSCCQRAAQTCHKTDDSDPHKCTKKANKYLKLHTPFESASSYSFAAFVFIADIPALAFSAFEYIPLHSQKATAPLKNRPPPHRYIQPYGKTLLPYIQSFLC